MNPTRPALLLARRAPGRAARTLLAALAAVALTSACGGDDDDDGNDDQTPVAVRLLAVNDFHGNLETTGLSSTLPDPANAGATVRVNTGGAAYVATQLKALREGQANVVTLSTGDLIGASPLASSLFRDEPTIEVMNAIGIDLNVVGNHEFDKGLAELQRLEAGGCSTDTSNPNVESCARGGNYAGADFGFLAANVVDADGTPIFPATAVRTVGGRKIGFIGVVTTTTPTIVSPSGVQGLRFLDEAETLDKYAAELNAEGVKAIVAMVHEGGSTSSGFDDPTCANATGRIFEIADAIDDAIDVVFSAHTHQGYNCVRQGKVVIQGLAFGRAISQVDVVIDPATDDIDRRLTVAHNVPVVNDTNSAEVAAKFPPLAADADVKAIVDAYVALAQPKAARVIGQITEAITRTPEATSGGDHPAGRLIADSQLAATQAAASGDAQIAFMNPGGVRADFVCAAGPCDLSFGAAFTVQPFGNSLVVMTLTGAQLKTLLEQQGSGANAASPRILQPSAGFGYTWTASAAESSRASDLRLNGTPIDAAASYRITVNSFLAEGGDGFTVLRDGSDRLGGAQDIDALIDYLQAAGEAVAPVTTPRVVKG